MTRAEHVAWCKKRALEYADAGDDKNAVASMLSDMSKHPETRALAEGPVGMLGMMTLIQGNGAEVRRWIEGFN